MKGGKGRITAYFEEKAAKAAKHPKIAHAYLDVGSQADSNSGSSSSKTGPWVPGVVYKTVPVRQTCPNGLPTKPILEAYNAGIKALQSCPTPGEVVITGSFSCKVDDLTGNAVSAQHSIAVHAIVDYLRGRVKAGTPNISYIGLTKANGDIQIDVQESNPDGTTSIRAVHIEVGSGMSVKTNDVVYYYTTNSAEYSTDTLSIRLVGQLLSDFCAEVLLIAADVEAKDIISPLCGGGVASAAPYKRYVGSRNAVSDDCLDMYFQAAMLEMITSDAPATYCSMSYQVLDARSVPRLNTVELNAFHAGLGNEVYDNDGSSYKVRPFPAPRREVKPLTKEEKRKRDREALKASNAASTAADPSHLQVMTATGRRVDDPEAEGTASKAAPKQPEDIDPMAKYNAECKRLYAEFEEDSDSDVDYGIDENEYIQPSQTRTVLTRTEPKVIGPSQTVAEAGTVLGFICNHADQITKDVVEMLDIVCAGFSIGAIPCLGLPDWKPLEIEGPHAKIVLSLEKMACFLSRYSKADNALVQQITGGVIFPKG